MFIVPLKSKFTIYLTQNLVRRILFDHIVDIVENYNLDVDIEHVLLHYYYRC